MGKPYNTSRRIPLNILSSCESTVHINQTLVTYRNMAEGEEGRADNKKRGKVERVRGGEGKVERER